MEVEADAAGEEEDVGEAGELVEFVEAEDEEVAREKGEDEAGATGGEVEEIGRVTDGWRMGPEAEDCEEEADADAELGRSRSGGKEVRLGIADTGGLFLVAYCGGRGASGGEVVGERGVVDGGLEARVGEGGEEVWRPVRASEAIGPELGIGMRAASPLPEAATAATEACACDCRKGT